MAGLRTVGVRLAAEVSGYVNNLRTAARSTRDFTGELDRAARAGKLDAVADKATHMGLMLAGGFALAVGAAAKFDKEMSAVSAATHASAGDMDRLRQAALQAGKDTQFSATEAAQGIEELSKAGVSTAAILSGGLKGALDLAAAGQIEVGEAAETAASAMTQFKLQGGQVPHVADLLAAGAGKAQGSVHDLSMALNQGGLVASQMGLSIEDTTGTLAAFASAGLMGSDAGTSLKTALLMLANPTDKARSTMEQLGISAYDASGNFVGVVDLAGQLQDKLGGLTQEQRNAALATIFGSDAIRSASILYQQGAKGIQGWIDKTNDAGYAAETARRKTDNLSGDIERLTGSLETLAIQSGSGANGGLRTLTKSANALVDQFADLPPAVGSGVTVIAGIAGAALLAGAGWVKMRRSTAEALAELRAVGPAGARAATGLQTTVKWAGRATAAFVALQVAGAALHAMQKDLNIQTEALGKGLADWGKSGVLAGESARVLGGNLKDLSVGLKFLADTDNSRRKFSRWGQDLLETVVPGLDGTNTSLTKTRERVAAMDQALASLVQAGQADQAAAAFQRLAEMAAKDGVSIDELKRLFPAYAGAVEVAGKASGDAAPKVGAVGDAASTAADGVEALKTAFDKLFGERISYDKALIAYRQGIADVRKELETGTRTLNTNKQAGRDNATGVLDQIERIKDLRQARLDHNMSLDDANAKYKTDIKGLRDTLIQLGYNKTAVDELIGGYLAIPDEAKTEVSAPGADGAKKKTNDFNFALMQLPGGKVVSVTADTYRAMKNAIALAKYLRNIPDEDINVAIRITGQSPSQARASIAKQYAQRWGGITEHAQTGLLREAAIYSPMGPARYAFAEPATGGELFAPKYGNLANTIANVSYGIENWWGGWQKFLPGTRSGGSGRSVTVNNAITVNAAPGQSPQQIAREVSRIIGREANIYAR